jgi:hypothetical protein
MSYEETYNETSARKEDRVYMETRESAQGDDEGIDVDRIERVSVDCQTLMHGSCLAQPLTHPAVSGDGATYCREN